MRVRLLVVMVAMIMLASPSSWSLPGYEGTNGRNIFLEKYGITYLTASHGMPSNFVDDILVDSRGFLWIALSGGGLARYDGYDFDIYNTSSSPVGIKGNFVTNVVEDSFGRLWIVSDGGLNILSLDSFEDVTTETLSTLPESLLPLIQPSFIMTDSHDRVWLTNNERIICLVAGKDGTIADYYTMTLTPSRLSQVILGNLDEMGEVWGSVGGQISRLLTSDNHILTTEAVHPELVVPRDCYIGAYLERDGEVWIATADGLVRYGRELDRIRWYWSDPGDPASISQNFVTSLALLPDNTLVVGTLHGLNVYDQLNDNFTRLYCDPVYKFNGINCNFINGLKFSAGCLWVGTEGGGINKISPRRLISRMITNDTDNPSSLPNHPVNALYNDEKGRVWIGNVEGGLQRTDIHTQEFSHFTTSNSPLTHNSVSAVVSDLNGGLWVGTWGGGINHLDIDNPTRPLSQPYLSVDGCLATDYIGMLAYDPYNRLVWVGCSKGIYFISVDTGEIREAFPDSWKEADGCLGGLVTSKGELWVGGIKGLIVFDLKRGFDISGEIPYRLLTGDNVPKRVTYIVESEVDRKLYISTNGNGLFSCESTGTTDIFENLSDRLGSNLTIAGLAFDEGYNLWIATISNLLCLRPDRNVISFGDGDGMSPTHFYWNASLTLPDGDILFGCTEGALRITSPHRTPAFSPQANEKFSGNKVVFTRMFADHEPVTAASEYISRDISNGEGVTVHQRVKSIGFEFSALDYIGGFSGHYEYRLYGFEQDWIPLPRDRHYIAYTNLPPGNYNLQVRYLADGQAYDSASVTSLPVEITPYFYNRVWFIILVIILLATLFVGGYKLRLKSLIRQRKRLMDKIDERTHEIEHQKDLLQSHADDLMTTNEQLRQRNDEIEQQKEQISEMNSYVQRINLERLNFFTNITHEFRTPITLIMGPISRALKLSTNPQVIEQLNLVERNSRYLLSLVNQLMDFRRIESGKMEVTLSSSNIIDMIEEMLKPFRSMGAERNITIDFLHHIGRPIISHDEDATRKVLTNFIANALKFTPEGGRIVIYLSLFRPKDGEDKPRLYLSVSDTGPGIPPEDLGHVFDRFYQGHTTMRYPAPGGTTGSGIGLYLCQQIIEMYNGEISVKNNSSGKGCTFRTLFPVSANEESPVVVSSNPEEAASVDEQFPREGLQKQVILVVEDNEDMRYYIKSILTSTYDILEAENGKEALGILHTCRVDFIITDLMMPVMDGSELARRVKSDFEISHIPILVLTAKTAQAVRLESYRVGVEEYLLKPFDEKILVTRIRNILDNKRRYQQQFNSRMKAEELNIESESRDKRFMDQVMEVLKNNYKNSHFDVGDFAEALGVSRTLLNNKLSNLAGQSAVTLIRSYRMTVAKEMILRNRQTRQYNISEIAYEVGFNDSKYFTRCFTRHFGMPPSSMLAGEDSIDR